MDIKQLQYLCALDDYGHFGQAADACHVTQPTLSMRIKSLEEELGLSLVQRGQRFEGFTSEGQCLLAWARQVINAYDGMKTEVSRLKGTLVGTLRIGMVPLSHVCLLPLLKLLREQAPQMRYQLHSLSSEIILEQIESNVLDIGLTYLPQTKTDQYQILALGSPAIGLLSPPTLFGSESSEDHEVLDWNRIAELPLGLLSTSMRFRQGIDSSAAAHGVVLRPVIESDAVDHLIECVNVGLCCTLIPLPAPASLMLNHLRVQPLTVNLNQLPLALICRNNEHDKLTLALMQQAEQWVNLRMV